MQTHPKVGPARLCFMSGSVLESYFFEPHSRIYFQTRAPSTFDLYHTLWLSALHLMHLSFQFSVRSYRHHTTYFVAFNISAARYHSSYTPTMSTRGGRGRGGRHGDGVSETVIISKAVSYTLRHAAIKEGLALRPDGYANVGELVKASIPHFHSPHL
jgi:hypothetical protein